MTNILDFIAEIEKDQRIIRLIEFITTLQEKVEQLEQNLQDLEENLQEKVKHLGQSVNILEQKVNILEKEQENSKKESMKVLAYQNREIIGLKSKLASDDTLADTKCGNKNRTKRRSSSKQI